MQNVELENHYQEVYSRAKCFKGLFAHDISNLFHIIGNSFELCEMLLKDGIRTEDILEYFQLIRKQIKRGIKLVKNFRNLSDLEESEMPLKHIDLLEDLDSAVQFVKANFPERNIEIKVNYKHKTIYVIANELLLDVFENIILNSIIYNQNKIVEIEVLITEIAESSKNFIKLEFKDNGIGIEDTRKIQVLHGKNKRNRNPKRLGIGLSLVANLIQLFKGSMWIEDRIKGNSSKGSKFVILIPKANQVKLYNRAYQKDRY
jgi:signal transduction histidine kinase